MSNRLNARYKEYVRQDASHSDVAGTNIYRLKMPKNGNWREITQPNACCYPYYPYTEMSYTPADVTDDTFIVRILCDATVVFQGTANQATATTDIDGVADLLNDKLGYLGAFGVSASDITLKLKQEIADSYNCTGTISFTVLTS